ncbi:hypothetical protein QBC38DRAFT_378528 [Podospora fimiseda]|uniref:Secreted protein n=1 Tax=Podospora fimiseda TaxID=252190 RepID=A0AAN6YQT5_9PEZI|nr:hypothetical protein QBC38DRAFT_378528 [Podospora fimiseda]
MKFLFAVIAFIASIVLATPASEHYTLHSTNDVLANSAITPFWLEGPITPGGPEIRLNGTAKQIYEQIISLNPSYDPYNFPEFAAQQQAKGISRQEFHKRNVNCDWGSWVEDSNRCAEGFDYLRRLGTARCGAYANSCSRVSCSHNCGVWLCSSVNREIGVHCYDIANTDMRRIIEVCGRRWLGDRYIMVRGNINWGAHNVGVGSDSC